MAENKKAKVKYWSVIARSVMVLGIGDCRGRDWAWSRFCW